LAGLRDQGREQDGEVGAEQGDDDEAANQSGHVRFPKPDGKTIGFGPELTLRQGFIFGSGGAGNGRGRRRKGRGLAECPPRKEKAGFRRPSHFDPARWLRPERERWLEGTA